MSLKSGRFSSSSSPAVGWGDLKIFFTPTVREYKTKAKRDIRLVVKDIGQAKKTVNRKDRGEEKMEWTIREKEENSVVMVTWADMIDEAIGCTGLYGMRENKPEFNESDENVTETKENIVKEKNSLRNFCCLFVLASSLLIPVFAASLYIFLSCYSGNLETFRELAPIAIKEVGPQMNGNINTSEIERNIKNTEENTEKNSRNLPKDDTSAKPLIYDPFFPSKMLEKKVDDIQKKLRKNSDLSCILPFILLFGTIFFVLLTFVFIVGYSCTHGAVEL